MNPLVADQTDAQLARLVEQNWESLEADLANRFGGVVEDREGLFRFQTTLHSGFLNGVIRASATPDGVPELVRDMRAWFPADVPWRWVVGPSSRPENLADLLADAGVERRWAPMPGMALDLAAPRVDPGTPEGGRVTEVETPEDLEAWLSVRHVNLSLDDRTIAAWRRAHLGSGLGPQSHMRHFVGWLGDRPVAGATLFLNPAPGGISGIYHVDTLVEARGRGFAKALTVAALDAAREQGYRWTVLGASTLGTPVYLRLGFRTVGWFTVLVGGGH